MDYYNPPPANRNDPLLQCKPWGYNLFHFTFDWKNWNQKRDRDEKEDAAKSMLHGFATEQIVGYVDAQKYGSGFGAGVEIKDSAWTDSIRMCDRDYYPTYNGASDDPQRLAGLEIACKAVCARGNRFNDRVRFEGDDHECISLFTL